MEAINAHGLNRVKDRMEQRRFRCDEMNTRKRKTVFRSDDSVHDAMDDKKKIAHRERIANHFVRHTRNHRFTRCFSLPGKRWHFENLLHEKRKRRAVNFVAAERVYRTLEYSMRYMPRAGKTTAGFLNVDNVTLATTNKATCANMTSLALMRRIADGDKSWSRLGFWDCFWWDLQSPLICLDVALMVKLLPKCLNKEADLVPFAITFLVGRDTMPFESNTGGSPIAKRAACLARQMKQHHWSVRIQNLHQYQSKKGAQMGLMIGTIRR